MKKTKKQFTILQLPQALHCGRNGFNIQYYPDIGIGEQNVPHKKQSSHSCPFTTGPLLIAHYTWGN